MNQPTKAFLKQLVALCDAYDVEFYVGPDPHDDTHRVEGVVFRGPHNRKNLHRPQIKFWVTSLDNLKDKLANDKP